MALQSQPRQLIAISHPSRGDIIAINLPPIASLCSRSGRLCLYASGLCWPDGAVSGPLRVDITSQDPLHWIDDEILVAVWTLAVELRPTVQHDIQGSLGLSHGQNLMLNIEA